MVGRIAQDGRALFSRLTANRETDEASTEGAGWVEWSSAFSFRATTERSGQGCPLMLGRLAL